MPHPDAEYTRQFCLCTNFASDGTCTRPGCQFSHTLLDTARLVALVGDTGGSSAAEEKTHVLVEYTRHSTLADDAGPEPAPWRMRLLAGGRATLCAAGLGADPGAGSVSVQPAYPVKGQAREAGAALDALERRVFGRSHPPDPVHRTVCKMHLNEVCRAGPACRYSHTLFDTARVVALLAEAVDERGYADFRPLAEIEYVRQPGGAFMWRVTLRCIVGGYQQKAAPQPVVVTGVDLSSAFRLLERQFAASAGKPMPPPPSSPHAGFSSHRRNSTATPRPARGHTRQRSAPNAAPRAQRAAQPTPPRPAPSAPPSTSDARPAFPESPSVHDPPPSYHDTMRATSAPSHAPGFDAKRRL